ncbi:MAG: hypothetical protein Tsb002_05460 [Wenzhouxiangellaceae bacterium]
MRKVFVLMLLLVSFITEANAQCTFDSNWTVLTVINQAEDPVKQGDEFKVIKHAGTVSDRQFKVFHKSASGSRMYLCEGLISDAGVEVKLSDGRVVNYRNMQCVYPFKSRMTGSERLLRFDATITREAKSADERAVEKCKNYYKAKLNADNDSVNEKIREAIEQCSVDEYKEVQYECTMEWKISSLFDARVMATFEGSGQGTAGSNDTDPP